MQYFRSLLAASGLGGGYVIEGSGVFGRVDDYLTLTYGATASSTTERVVEVLVKFDNNFTTGDGRQSLFDGYRSPSPGSSVDMFNIEPDGKIRWYQEASAIGTGNYTTAALLRDPGAWYQIVLQIKAAAGDVSMWVNGVSQTLTETTQKPVNQTLHALQDTCRTRIGAAASAAAQDCGSYIARVTAIDGGSALDISDFGETTTDGYWQINDVSGLTFGTNGFLLEGGVNMAAGTDSSGNGNNFTKTGTITATNDSPTDDAAANVYGNYCTWNPETSIFTTTCVLSDGNLQSVGAGGNAVVMGTISVSSGKWYWEVNDGVQVIGVALDMDGLTCTWYKANAAQHTSIAIASGTYVPAMDGQTTRVGVGIHKLGTINSYAAELFSQTAIGNYTYWSNDGILYKSGQANEAAAATFNNSSTSTANFGQSAFTYTPPTGFKALCTANLPAPAIPDPSEHHQVELVAHDGTSTAFTCNWDADVYDTLFIIKNRDAVEKWFWVNGLRGYNKYTSSNATTTETTDANVLTVSGTTITLGSTLLNNGYVVECHKAGLAVGGTSNTDGSTTSTISANTVSGFVLGYYTGTAANATVGTGLDSPIEILHGKSLTFARGWMFGATALGWTKYMQLNSIAAAATLATAFNSTAPTSTVFSLGSDGTINTSGETVMFYAWHSVPGYSAFGSYVGNGSVNGPMVTLNMKPKTTLLTRHDGVSNWFYTDTARDAYNETTLELLPEATNAEGTSTGAQDILSNGFKLKENISNPNGTGFKYIYCAWGGTPIQGNGTDASQGRAR